MTDKAKQVRDALNKVEQEITKKEEYLSRYSDGELPENFSYFKDLEELNIKKEALIFYLTFYLSTLEERKMELRPCPFCRSHDVFVERMEIEASAVFCNNCGSFGATCNTEDQKEADWIYENDKWGGYLSAIAAWNTRATDE